MGEQCDDCLTPINPKDLKDKKCKICGSSTIVKENKHLYFKLSAFQEILSKFVESHKDDYASYGTVGAYIFRRVDDTIYTDEIYGLDVIENQMIKRNRKGEEKGHVR